MFKKRKRARHTAKRKKQRNNSKNNEILQLIERLDNLQSQFSVANILLRKHDEEILEHSALLEKHSEKLEQLVADPTVRPAKIDLLTSNQAAKPVERQITYSNPAGKFDIARFSQQEKRILSVFFNQKDMALSYADIARYLNKSPNTIKNQLRQINMKAELFNYFIGSENRKRFKLKEGLKIEKYLNTGTEVTNWSGQNDHVRRIADKL